MPLQPSILLLDDDEDDLMLLKEAITAFDGKYDFVEFRDGRSGVSWLKEAERSNSLPSLIILDINMPVLDGREVLAILKSQETLRNIPVVVFTTSSSPSDVKYCSQFNVEMLTKPFDLSQYENAARKMISLSRPASG